MTVNKELLLKTLETIKANPEHWNQEEWHCGTSHCFAGFTHLIDAGLPITTICPVWGVEYDDGGWDFTEEYAAKALGLDKDQADLLFYVDNKLEDLEVIVDNLITGNI